MEKNAFLRRAPLALSPLLLAAQGRHVRFHASTSPPDPAGKRMPAGPGARRYVNPQLLDDYHGRIETDVVVAGARGAGVQSIQRLLWTIEQMKQQGVLPTVETYVRLFNAAVKSRREDLLRRAWMDMIAAGLVPTPETYTAYLQACRELHMIKESIHRMYEFIESSPQPPSKAFVHIEPAFMLLCDYHYLEFACAIFQTLVVRERSYASLAAWGAYFDAVQASTTTLRRVMSEVIPIAPSGAIVSLVDSMHRRQRPKPVVVDAVFNEILRRDEEQELEQRILNSEGPIMMLMDFYSGQGRADYCEYLLRALTTVPGLTVGIKHLDYMIVCYARAGSVERLFATMRRYLDLGGELNLVTSSKFLNLSKGDALEVALKLLRDKDTSFVEAANLLLAVSNRTKDPRLFADVILAMNEAGVKPNVATFVEILLSDKAPPEVYLPAADGILLSSTPVSNSPLSLVVINLLKLGHNEKALNVLKHSRSLGADINIMFRPPVILALAKAGLYDECLSELETATELNSRFSRQFDEDLVRMFDLVGRRDELKPLLTRPEKEKGFWEPKSYWRIQ